MCNRKGTERVFQSNAVTLWSFIRRFGISTVRVVFNKCIRIRNIYCIVRIVLHNHTLTFVTAMFSLGDITKKTKKNQRNIKPLLRCSAMIKCSLRWILSNEIYWLYTWWWFELQDSFKLWGIAFQKMSFEHQIVTILQHQLNCFFFLFFVVVLFVLYSVAQPFMLCGTSAA